MRILSSFTSLFFMPDSGEISRETTQFSHVFVEDVKTAGFNLQLKVMQRLTFCLWKGDKGAEPTPG